MTNILLWLCLASIWGSSYLAIKIGITDIDPFYLVLIRMILAALVLLLFQAKALLTNPLPERAVWVALVAGLSGNVIPFCLISFGELHVDSGLAALLMAIAPVASVALAPLVHEEEILTPRILLGVAVAVTGMVVLIGPAVLGEIGHHFWGQMAILAAALCYAFTTLFVRRYSIYPALQMTTLSVVTGTIALFPIALVFGDVMTLLTAQRDALAAAIYLGLIPTALATAIYFFLMPRIGAARMSLVNFAVPIIGILLGAILLGEQPETSTLLALPILLLGIILVAVRGKATSQR